MNFTCAMLFPVFFLIFTALSRSISLYLRQGAAGVAGTPRCVYEITDVSTIMITRAAAAGKAPWTSVLGNVTAFVYAPSSGKVAERRLLAM